MLTRDDVIRMAREAGFPFNKYGMLHGDEDGEIEADKMFERFYDLAVLHERESRKAAQLETIELREELTKRAMQAEKEAYQRGVRDEREACASLCNKYAELMLNGRDGCAPITIAMICQIVKSSNELASLIRLRSNQGSQQ